MKLTEAQLDIAKAVAFAVAQKFVVGQAIEMLANGQTNQAIHALSRTNDLIQAIESAVDWRGVQEATSKYANLGLGDDTAELIQRVHRESLETST
jgi:hypothetical protein